MILDVVVCFLVHILVHINNVKLSALGTVLCYHAMDVFRCRTSCTNVGRV
jgi:hypothetical protein